MTNGTGWRAPLHLVLHLVLWLIAGCAAPGRSGSDESAVPDSLANLRGPHLDRWFTHIVPAGQERWYGRHDWLPDVGAGLYAAAESDRPLLLWIMSGDPLHCDCAHELEGRRSVWSDPTVEQLVAGFVPAVDVIWELLTRTDPEARWVRELLGGSPPAGVYMLAPSGEILARCHTLEADGLLEALGAGLERFSELGATRRALPRSPVGLLENRFERYYPENGLVLTRFARELPQDRDPGGTRSQIVSRDQVWFSQAEVRGLVPKRTGAGEQFQVPAPLVRRLARLHFLDDLRGPVRPFSAADVERAEWVGRVTSRRGDLLELEYSGQTRAVGREAESGAFGVETTFAGRAAFDLRADRFVSFRLVATGLRFGRTPNNARLGQEAPSPIGYALDLTAATPLRRAPPRFSRLYADAGYAPATANAGAGR